MTKDELLMIVNNNVTGVEQLHAIHTAVDAYTSALLQQCNVSGSLPVDKVTRVEVIDKGGRAYVSWNKSNKVELQLQDSNRTLKVFVSDLKI